MNISDYITNHRLDRGMNRLSPQLVCNDGFKFSVQASDAHGCIPLSNTGPWTHFEVGYTSQPEPLLVPNEDGIWYRVPEEVVLAIVAKHGGSQQLKLDLTKLRRGHPAYITSTNGKNAEVRKLGTTLYSILVGKVHRSGDLTKIESAVAHFDKWGFLPEPVREET